MRLFLLESFESSNVSLLPLKKRGLLMNTNHLLHLHVDILGHL